MDVLRKELNGIYESQNLGDETLDSAILDDGRRLVGAAVAVDNACRIITDASADVCYIFGGAFAALMGISDGRNYYRMVDSSDEDEIYNRIHPEDLVEKRMLEYEFFKYVDKIHDDSKLDYKAVCVIRVKNRRGEYIPVYNTTKILAKSPEGKIWLILCTYDFAPIVPDSVGISPRIINSASGEIINLSLGERRSMILSEREKEVLVLIKEGRLSKQIADILGISIHTVNRHRQNILDKLSVGNSVEAVWAATAMKLL